MAAFMRIPRKQLDQTGLQVAGAVCTLFFGTFAFTMRAVFSAPMDEGEVHHEITGAAMGLASLHLPS